MENLEKFIVKAKANGWVGAESGGKKIGSPRRGSLDVVYEEGDFFYQDSFVGLTDFCGQEHICFKDEPIWSMAYYGYLVRPDLFNGSRTVEVLKKALAEMYRQNRFLGSFEYHYQQCEYRDSNRGDFKNFEGREEILLEGTLVYELRYFGGLVRK
jgi:hypothetical protein